MSAFGIPYAHQNDDGTVTCPVCDERIVQTARKDFESFSGREYADHFARLHEPFTERDDNGVDK